ncbi:PorT family protein [Chryseobacterium sp. Ch-15]|uniref:Outer membrane beta-barrel protein n=1 Tax=Chryseobacterium muglaense TaxID=2893752 RepID=A0A9Q3UW04_9FLAO|nr:outer membrane beta-barrel protein [Chryseobacterium muglaense]MBD3904271.1 outer membrane beta-barrel protein [Chryseobacterium muglaense]MCC9035412.1 PorT family protein [Chryseobacterium muglaense]MCM2553923.1 PorT family protein [Chryseobacterium muglaense]
MKKLISAALIGFSVFASAQISLAAKANAVIPTSSASWKNLKSAATNAVEQKGKNITGFNVGLSLKIDLPTALYLMPEIYYTNFSNEVTVQNDVNAAQTTIKAKNSRIDIPVLVGVNLLGNLLSAYAGPVGSFNLAKSDNFDNFVQKVDAKEFTVGYQLGVQSEIKKLILSARYEGAFSKDQRKFINTVAGSSQEINYDNRSSLFLLGLGYKF